MHHDSHYAAFLGETMLSAGPLGAVLKTLKARFDEDPGAMFLIFEDATGKQVDFDLRGTPAEVQERYQAPEPRTGPGRPKLGVVSREVTLLPRHWEWLEAQSSGASAAIRRLVDEARKGNAGARPARAAAEAAGRFLTAMAGNLPGYEEACRALWVRDRSRFEELTVPWPEDIRTYARRLAQDAFQPD